MGLDMYLKRVPRKSGITMEQIRTINTYFRWQEAEKQGEKHTGYTLREWYRIDESELPSQDVIDFYKPYYVYRYAWNDIYKLYGSKTIIEQVGYWRKANQIHKWFVDHVQDGKDDCRYHKECTKDILEELLDTCRKVLDSCKLVPGMVESGCFTSKNGELVPFYVPGNRIEDSSVAEKLLPPYRGCAFGRFNYDEWYVEDIEETIKILEKVLATTNFENQMIYYVSSW